MKRGLVLIAVLGLWSLPLAAGEFHMNDSGETATALRVMFSEPVVITSFGDTLMDVSPSGESDEFIFTGGEVEAWGGQWLNWEPTSAELVSAEWLGSGWDLPEDATAEDFDYEVALDGISATVRISRHIDRKCLPFLVRYEVVNPETLAGYELSWDTDKYVDNDGNGNPQDDRDYDGPSLELTYIENYNPTVTMLILDSQGSLADQWENMVRNDFMAGEAVALNGQLLANAFDIELAGLRTALWAQLHMERASLEYRTEYSASLSSPDSLQCEARAPAAGRYVYELRIDAGSAPSRTATCAAWVVEEAPEKQVGILMYDIWNECYSAECACMWNCASWFSDADARAKLVWLRGQGMERINIMNQFPIIESNPLPVGSVATPGAQVIPDDDLEALYGEVIRGDLSLQTYHFGTSGDTGIDLSYWRAVDERSTEYYDTFFMQYDEHVKGLADLAEQLGLESLLLGWLNPFLREGLCNRRGTGDYALAHWLEILDEVRNRYSGRLGIGVPYPCDNSITLANTVDFLCEWLGFFRARSEYFESVNSTLDLRSAYNEYLQEVIGEIHASFGKPIRLAVNAYSFTGASTKAWFEGMDEAIDACWNSAYADGTYSEAMLEGQTCAAVRPDFREQVRMIETLMPALGNASFVDDIFCYYEHWRLLDFDPFVPASVQEYYTLFSGSLQGKPGFQAYRLWASILDPNEILAYRLEIGVPECDLNPPVVVDPSGDLTSPVWEEMPVVLEISRDYIPTSYWYNGDTVAISQSTHWDTPGHEIRRIGFRIECDGADIHWESYDGGLRGGFEYWIRFHFPQPEMGTLFVIVSPKDGTVRIILSSSDGWQSLPNGSVSYRTSDDSVSVHLPPAALPDGYAISELMHGPIEFDLVYQLPTGPEFYGMLPAWIRYSDYAASIPECQ